VGSKRGLLYTREGNVTLLVLFVALLLIAGVTVSRSRAGLGVMFAAVVLVTLLVAFNRGWLAGVITLVLSPLLVLALIVLIFVGAVVIGGSWDELASSDLWMDPVGYVSTKAGLALDPWEEETRLVGRQATWEIFRDFRMFGTGLGTFHHVYPNYLKKGPLLYFSHCDPVQWLAETGLAGGVLALALLAAGLWTVVRGLMRLKDPFFRVLLLGCVVGCLACLGHGLIDYPFQVPGVTIIFVTLAAVSVILGNDQIARHEEEEFTF